MSGRRKLTDEQLDVLGIMRERGTTLGQLRHHAQVAFGVTISANALSWQMLRIGADLPPERRYPSRPGTPVVQRGNHIVRRFTPDEDLRLVQLERKGLGYAAIGRLMDRKPNSVRGRLMTLARHDERREEAGQ